MRKTFSLIASASLMAIAGPIAAQDEMAPETSETEEPVEGTNGAALSPDQQAAYDSWPPDQQTSYDAWPAETQGYYWTLAPNRQELFWRLSDEDRVLITTMSGPDRESTWQVIEARAAGTAEPAPEGEME